jgi:hypothetical protein
MEADLYNGSWDRRVAHHASWRHHNSNGVMPIALKPQPANAPPRGPPSLNGPFRDPLVEQCVRNVLRTSRPWAFREKVRPTLDPDSATLQLGSRRHRMDAAEEDVILQQTRFQLMTSPVLEADSLRTERSAKKCMPRSSETAIPTGSVPTRLDLLVPQVGWSSPAAQVAADVGRQQSLLSLSPMLGFPFPRQAAAVESLCSPPETRRMLFA